MVGLESEEDKRGIWEKKKNLKGSKMWIDEDLTWMERKIKWKLREIAKEKQKGKCVSREK